MSQGIKTTFELLGKTRNEAAASILIPALDSEHAAIREGALRAILQRHSPAAHREIVKRLHTFDDQWRAIVKEQHFALSAAVRDALLSSEAQLSANGFHAAVWFREYDLIPALINVVEGEAHPNRDQAGRTLLELADALYDELSSPREMHRKRDPQLIRRYVVAALDESVKRYSKHRRNEPVEAFLLLVNREHTTLKQILGDIRHGSYLAIANLLAHSERLGVMRLALSFLDDPRAPSATINLLAHRSDPRFISGLLRKVGYEPSTHVATNLKRMEIIPWLQGDLVLLDELENVEQHAAIQVAIRSSLPRPAVFNVVKHLLQRGKVGGRRAAGQALADFSGAEANSLALRAVADSDPQVQAFAAGQLRQRGMPGALSKLIELLSSPHEIVRAAVRGSLSEFTLQKFLALYDMVDDDVRRSTGALVKLVDPNVVPQLAEELTAKSRTRRLRGVAVASVLEVVPQLERLLIELLQDEDHRVRVEVARSLAHSNTAATREALARARNDRSFAVQEAAEESLEHLAYRPFLPNSYGQGPPLAQEQSR